MFYQLAVSMVQISQEPERDYNIHGSQKKLAIYQRLNKEHEWCLGTSELLYLQHIIFPY